MIWVDSISKLLTEVLKRFTKTSEEKEKHLDNRERERILKAEKKARKHINKRLRRQR